MSGLLLRMVFHCMALQLGLSTGTHIMDYSISFFVFFVFCVFFFFPRKIVIIDNNLEIGIIFTVIRTVGFISAIDMYSSFIGTTFSGVTGE